MKKKSTALHGVKGTISKSTLRSSSELLKNRKEYFVVIVAKQPATLKNMVVLYHKSVYNEGSKIAKEQQGVLQRFDKVYDPILTLYKKTFPHIENLTDFPVLLLSREKK